MSAFHNQQTTADGIHILVRWEYNTVADMYAGAYTSADDGGLARVGAAAPYNYYLLRDSATANAAAGWADVAQGTGDFSGPVASNAGNAVEFADGTGKVGADSGKAAANIPSSLPVQFAEGGTGATSQQTAMEGLSPSIKRTLWVNTDYTGTGTGSVNAPYQTIGSALAAIGPATSGAEEDEAWIVEVAPGFYDENLVFPSLRSVTLRCAGGLAVLSDATLTSSRSITINHNSAPAGTFPKMASFQGFGMTGPLVASALGAGADLELTLTNVQWISGAFAGVCVDATGWPNGPHLRLELEDVRLQTSGPDLMVSNTAFPGADVVLSRAFFCDLSGGDITLGAYSQIDTCRLEGKHTWKLASAIATNNVQYPQGYFNCSWSNPAASAIDAQSAGDFMVDATSYRRSEGIAFLGSAVFVGDPYKGVSNPYVPLTGADWQVSPVGDQNMKKALDRIANALNGLLGGGGIP
jgi:hypothetical protein